MKRNGLPFFSASAPCRTDGAFQNVLSAARACAPILHCSYTLVMMMYQLPIDMMTRIASVILATMSPPFHRASRPYGLSTTSVGLAAAFGGGRRGGRGGGAAGGRGRCGGGRRGAASGRCAAERDDARRTPRRAGPRPARPDGSSSACCLQTFVDHRKTGSRTDAFGRFKAVRRPRRQAVSRRRTNYRFHEIRPAPATGCRLRQPALRGDQRPLR